MFYISDQKEQLQMDAMLHMLHQTYWAAGRTEAQMRQAIDHSVCFGAYQTETGRQIGLVRIVTDFTTVFYVCDVVVDPRFRGRGVSKALLEAATSDPAFSHLRGLLVTKDAHGLYRQFGFREADHWHMGREAKL